MKFLLISIFSLLFLSFQVFSQNTQITGVKPIPSGGLSGSNPCIYEVSVTKDKEKTFVTLQGKDLNSFGESNTKGTDGFKESILRSLYRSQRDKRDLICSDYPKILEECGGVVRKKKKKEVVKLSSPKKVQLEETKKEPIKVTKKKKDKKKPVVKTKPFKPKTWSGTLFKCQVGCLYPYWDSAGNNYDEDLNLITK